MFKENFLNLKEIASLQRNIEEIYLKIDSQKKRITDTQNQIKERKEKNLNSQKELQALVKDLSEKEKLILGVQKRLIDAKENLNSVVSQKQAVALEHEIKSLEIQFKALEELILNFMEKQEELSQEISDFDNFESGVFKTLKNIESEVLNFSESEGENVRELKQRADNLVSLLPPNFISVFNPVFKKYKSRFLTPIDKGKCGECKMSIPSSTCQEVETGLTLETCSNCGRILIPSHL